MEEFERRGVEERSELLSDLEAARAELDETRKSAAATCGLDAQLQDEMGQITHLARHLMDSPSTAASGNGGSGWAAAEEAFSPTRCDGVSSYAHAHELAAALEAAAAAEAAVSAMASRLEQAERRTTAAEARATEAEVAAEVAAAAQAEDVRALEALVATTYASPAAAGQREPDDDARKERRTDEEERMEEERRRTEEGWLAAELESAKHALATQGAQQEARVASLRSQVRALEVQLHAAALEAAEEKAAEAVGQNTTTGVPAPPSSPLALPFACQRHIPSTASAPPRVID